MILEIAVFSLEAAILAWQSGADRIELCSAPAEGGLTPSAATLRLAHKYIPIPVHAMIRPREGDFCYTDKEFETMFLDVMAAKHAGVEGIVTGILLKDGTVDVPRMKLLLEAAGSLQVTFHRAFDMAADPFKALESLIECGVTRILTSGGKPSAASGVTTIKALVEKAGDCLTIMPGSGINKENICKIMTETGAKEFHLSARTFVPGKMDYRNPGVSMGGLVSIPDYDILMPDPEQIRQIRNIIC